MEGQSPLSGYAKEITEFYAEMKEFTTMEMVDIFTHLSQFTSRASEIRARLGTRESRDQAAFRTRIIDPFIEECDRQFKLFSRIQAIHEMDAKLAGGRFT